jgi:hypothetical protein
MTLERLFKLLLSACAIGLLGIAATACGGTGKGTSPASRAADATTTARIVPLAEEKKLDPDRDTDIARPDEDDSDTPPPPDRDNDADGNGHSRYDNDDSSVLDFGHSAKVSDRGPIAALIRRYYATAAAEDGAKACSMLYSIYAEAVPEDYGTSPPGPAYARGTTCPAVMTLVFKHSHDQIAARLPKLEVSRVRVRERQGVAVLSFGAMSEREIHLEREGRTWKILSLTDNELP